MKTPSTSDLTHSQANTAYDRLAVISDHMPMLHELCDFIFDLQDWLKANQHKFLQEFIDNMNSELEVVKANLESLALTHDRDKIALQNAINNINSSISNLTTLINQTDDKIVGLLVHSLNPSDDTHGATCKAIAEYVSTKISILTGNLGDVSTSLEDILNRLSSLEVRVTNLENAEGDLDDDTTIGTIIISGCAWKDSNNPNVVSLDEVFEISPNSSYRLYTNLSTNSGLGGGDGSMSGGSLGGLAVKTLYPPAKWKCVKAHTQHQATGGNYFVSEVGYYQLVEYLI